MGGQFSRSTDGEGAANRPDATLEELLLQFKAFVPSLSVARHPSLLLEYGCLTLGQVEEAYFFWRQARLTTISNNLKNRSNNDDGGSGVLGIGVSRSALASALQFSSRMGSTSELSVSSSTLAGGSLAGAPASRATFLQLSAEDFEEIFSPLFVDPQKHYATLQTAGLGVCLVTDVFCVLATFAAATVNDKVNFLYELTLDLQTLTANLPVGTTTGTIPMGSWSRTASEIGFGVAPVQANLRVTEAVIEETEDLSEDDSDLSDEEDDENEDPNAATATIEKITSTAVKFDTMQLTIYRLLGAMQRLFRIQVPSRDELKTFIESSVRSYIQRELVSQLGGNCSLESIPPVNLHGGTSLMIGTRPFDLGDLWQWCQDVSQVSLYLESVDRLCRAIGNSNPMIGQQSRARSTGRAIESSRPSSNSSIIGSTGGAMSLSAAVLYDSRSLWALRGMFLHSSITQPTFRNRHPLWCYRLKDIADDKWLEPINCGVTASDRMFTALEYILLSDRRVIPIHKTTEGSTGSDPTSASPAPPSGSRPSGSPRNAAASRRASAAAVVRDRMELRGFFDVMSVMSWLILVIPPRLINHPSFTPVPAAINTSALVGNGPIGGGIGGRRGTTLGKRLSTIDVSTSRASDGGDNALSTTGLTSRSMSIADDMPTILTRGTRAMSILDSDDNPFFRSRANTEDDFGEDDFRFGGGRTRRSMEAPLNWSKVADSIVNSSISELQVRENFALYHGATLTSQYLEMNSCMYNAVFLFSTGLRYIPIVHSMDPKCTQHGVALPPGPIAPLNATRLLHIMAPYELAGFLAENWKSVAPQSLQNATLYGSTFIKPSETVSWNKNLATAWYTLLRSGLSSIMILDEAGKAGGILDTSSFVELWWNWKESTLPPRISCIDDLRGEYENGNYTVYGTTNGSSFNMGTTSGNSSVFNSFSSHTGGASSAFSALSNTLDSCVQIGITVASFDAYVNDISSVKLPIPSSMTRSVVVDEPSTTESTQASITSKHSIEQMKSTSTRKLENSESVYSYNQRINKLFESEAYDNVKRTRRLESWFREHKCLTPSDSILAVLELMHATRREHVHVVSLSGDPVGVIRLQDICRALIVSESRTKLANAEHVKQTETLK